MHPKSLSVKQDVAASAQNLVTSAFPLLYREQMSTQAMLSAGIQVYPIVPPTLNNGVTPGGNFEGKNILEFVDDMDQRPTLAEARRALFEPREKRAHPGRDDVQLAQQRQLPSNAADGIGCIAKVLTSWNGLMLAAFAEAARTLDRLDYQEVAEHNAEFLPRELRQENGRLLRT